MLILYSFGVLGHKWFAKTLNNDLARGIVDDTTPVLVLEAISIVIKFASFNVAHWIFAFQYYKISRQAPNALNDSNLIQLHENCDSKLNKMMIFLNIIFPLMYGTNTFYWNYLLVTTELGPP